MPEKFKNLSETLLDPTFRSLAEEAVRDYVDWDQLAHRTLPPGLTLAETWEILGIIRQYGAIWFPMPSQDRRPFWYALNKEGHRCIGYIAHHCRSNSRLHEMMQGREGHRFLVGSRAVEVAAACRLDGIIADPKRIDRMLAEDRAARTDGERIALNSYHLLGELDALASEPFSPELAHSLYERLTEGVDLKKVRRGVRRTNLAGTSVSNEGRSEAERYSSLQQLCDYANGKTGDPQEPIPLKAYMILHVMGYWQPLAELNETVARHLYRLFAVKHDFPVLGYLPTSLMTERWFQGTLKPGVVRFTSLPRHPVVPGTIDGTEDVLTHLQLTTLAIDSLLGYIDVAQREDEELHAALDTAENINYRQRAVLARALTHPEEEIRIRQHETTHRVVYRTARTDLLDLADRGYLRKELRGKAFVFLPVDDLRERIEGRCHIAVPIDRSLA